MQKATQANWKAGLRTTILLATLTGLLVGLGYLIGGPGTAAMFLFFALAFNLVMYWFSDKIALKMSRAQPLSEEEAPRLHQMVRELAHSAGIPMPRLYMIPAGPAERVRDRPQPEALGRGRHAGHHAAAQRERAARRDRPRAGPHPEPRHPHDQRRGRDRRRDHLDLGYMLLFMGGDDDSPLGLVGALAMVILAPIAATIIQLGDLAPARVRGGRDRRPIAGSANALADALERLQAGAQAMPMQVNQAAEPLYIVKPFSGGGMAALFSTHPPIEERVRRLRELGV